jgi:fructokinase
MWAPDRLAGVELGGTKCIAVLAEDGRIIDMLAVPTREPSPTLAALRDQLLRWHAIKPLAALGIASFGPLQLDRDRAHFGSMLATPKLDWSGARVADSLVAGLSCPWQIDTDVNGAALAEYLAGAGVGCTALCYITVGTGVGGGLLIDGQPVHGAMHPEMGHLRVRRADGDAFEGVCPFHGDCIEGLVSGPALAARFGANAATVPDSATAWTAVASDLAELCGAILLVTSAQKILFGGSVLVNRPFLLPLIRERVIHALGSYLPFLTAPAAEDSIRIAGLGGDAGPVGAIALAAHALAEAHRGRRTA